MGRRSVLVVDDEVLMAGLIAEVLAAEGYLVETASSGPAALEKMRSTSFDLVLSDIRMPDMDGPALYRAAARLDTRLRERFIFLTGNAYPAEVAEFLAAHGAPCLAKPFDLRELQQLAEGRLNGR
jgi:CheY-like chemotaxis protein